MASTWRIGELCRRTGLTVRTLHHWDHVGLLRPSARTSSGHRLYIERDVVGLYLAKDPGLRDSLYRMQAENGAEIARQFGGPSPELIDYVKRAAAAD